MSQAQSNPIQSNTPTLCSNSSISPAMHACVHYFHTSRGHFSSSIPRSRKVAPYLEVHNFRFLVSSGSTATTTASSNDQAPRSHTSHRANKQKPPASQPHSQPSASQPVHSCVHLIEGSEVIVANSCCRQQPPAADKITAYIPAPGTV